MGDLRDLAINLAAAVIAFGSGIVTREIFRLQRSRRGRAFWGRRMLTSRTLLFVGEFPRFNHLEPSGMVGLGDYHALHELTTGLAAFGSSFGIAYASQITDGQPRENIIVLGGTDVNSLTSTVLDKVGSHFRLDDKVMVMVDERTGTTYRAEWDVDPLDGSGRHDLDHSWFISTDAEGARVALRFRTDYGILVRSQNPFAPDKMVLLICGVYGFGTWAGARLPFDDDFLATVAPLDNFECLFRVQVHQRQLLKTDIVALRPLPRTRAREPRLSLLRRRASRSGSRPPYELADSRPPSTDDGPPPG
ncbi:hypothetical protein [Symbioplanes lichenis]|uniref:hypothetical protein n=1 Tax=Symbioplanes lichenis TaxID=1629072 RepID=UPI002738FDFF|nr:hypothetical protein [Actinoplanes lichenis]